MQIKLNSFMRKQIVKAKSFEEAFSKCPLATEVSKVKGGYLCVNN